MVQGNFLSLLFSQPLSGVTVTIYPSPLCSSDIFMSADEAPSASSITGAFSVYTGVPELLSAYSSTTLLLSFAVKPPHCSKKRYMYSSCGFLAMMFSFMPRGVMIYSKSVFGRIFLYVTPETSLFRVRFSYPSWASSCAFTEAFASLLISPTGVRLTVKPSAVMLTSCWFPVFLANEILESEAVLTYIAS